MNIKTLATMALAVSQESKCPSHKVGAIIVKDGRVISTGYNGTTPNKPNPDEVAIQKGWAKLDPKDRTIKLIEEKSHLYSEWADSNVIHAEMNALLYAARASGGVEGATLVTSVSPCNNCVKHIIASGIKKVIYVTEYSRAGAKWKETLENAGVEVVHSPLFYQNYTIRVGRL